MVHKGYNKWGTLPWKKLKFAGEVGVRSIAAFSNYEMVGKQVSEMRWINCSPRCE